MIDQPTKMSQFGGLEKWPMPCPLFVDPTMVLVCHEGRLVHCRTLDSQRVYPLVHIQKTMENHHVQWVNQP